MSRAFVDRLLDALCRHARGQSCGAQGQFISRFLIPFLTFFRQGELTYPDSAADWQTLLINFLQFYLIDRSYSQQSVQTRIQMWRGAIAPVFASWREEKIIPRNVEIPKVDLKAESTAAADAPMLGRRRAMKTVVAAPVQKLLVDVGFAQNDADYLALVERECRTKVTMLRASPLS
jgi:hypothetical protein